LNAHPSRSDGESETFIACPVADTLSVGSNQTTGFPCGDIVAHALRAEGFDASEDGTGRGTPIVPVIAPEFAATLTRGAESAGKGGYAGRRQEDDVNLIAFDTTQITSATNRCNPQAGDPCHPLAAGAHPPAIAFDARQSDVIQYGDRAGPLDTDGHSQAIAFDPRQIHHPANFSNPKPGDPSHPLRAVANCEPAIAFPALHGWAVRRLTPTECEALQGFPRGYTDVPFRGKPAADGPRYKALGNSMACNVMRWIGRRIEAVEAISAASPTHQERAA